MVMKFVIDFKKWRAGGDNENKIGNGSTKLLNSLGFMCCLGQVSCQLGTSKNSILSVAAPCNVISNKAYKKISGVLLDKHDCHTKLAREAIIINDNETISPVMRMKSLVKLFKKEGHELKFENVPQKYNNI